MYLLRYSDENKLFMVPMPMMPMMPMVAVMMPSMMVSVPVMMAIMPVVVTVALISMVPMGAVTPAMPPMDPWMVVIFGMIPIALVVFIGLRVVVKILRKVIFIERVVECFGVFLLDQGIFDRHVCVNMSGCYQK